MKNSSVTYGDVERLLAQLGFASEDTNGRYKVFRHQSPDVLIILPPGRAGDHANPANVVAVRRHVVANGLLDDDDAFDGLLRDIGSGAATGS